jgi:DNA/RNA-binding domain of Phe-tRNA-synthetase-like protein
MTGPASAGRTALAVDMSDRLSALYPDLIVGFQAVHGVENPVRHEGLERRKTEVEGELNERFASYDRAGLRGLHPLDIYHRYFRSFGTAYPVQHQLESVVRKGRSIPSVAALVEAMFVVELGTLLLTAGHDRALLRPPLLLEAAAGQEPFERIDGSRVQLKPDDIYLRDQESIVGSVLYGPDSRTALSSSTREVVFVVYALPGIEEAEVEVHLRRIVQLVSLISPAAEAEEPLLVRA